MPPPQALALARTKGLDLVEISPTAVPPVCRIMDFGQYQYEQQKRARAAKNFAESDRIRDELAAMGVVLKDSKEGTTWEVAR